MLAMTVNEIQRSINGLGAIPTDFELACDRCFTPVHSGWSYGLPYRCGPEGHIPWPTTATGTAGLMGLDEFGQLNPMSPGLQTFYIGLQIVSTISIATLAFLAFREYHRK